MPRVGPDPARPQLPSGLPRRGFVAATATVASLGGLVDPLVRTAHTAGSDRLRFGRPSTAAPSTAAPSTGS
jgi:hypothetical protein